MKSIRLPGIAAYAFVALWLLQIMAFPARAESLSAPAPVRLVDLSSQILDALVAEGAPADARLTLSAPEAVILVAGERPRFESVSYNRSSGRFLIRLRRAEGEPLIAVTGSAGSPAFLPVAAREIARGETLGEDDLDWIEIADGRSAHYLADAEAVIGLAARRPIATGSPFRAIDLARPVLIKRGASVTVILESRGLRLTQTGVALANGSEGDLIAIRNVNSDREIKATVIGENLARAPFRAGATTIVSAE